MRAIWTGAIGFGLVNIPIKIYSATEDAHLSLDMLDKKNHANIKYQRVNASTGKEVAWENIVKGYKVDDEYVILDEKDFEKASPKKSQVIEIEEFALAEDIDTIYYDTPYYLEPAKGGERAYALLREALTKSGKVAVGSFVMRTKDNLCIIRPSGDLLLLIRMRFAHQIRNPEELKIPTERTAVKPAELKMAVSLIDQLTNKKFELDKYKDTYTDELMKLIKQKAKTGKVSAPRFKLAKKTTSTKDLMEQLKASLEPKQKKAS